jgi:ribosomal protein S18 acetylase RimI-like enzyme
MSGSRVTSLTPQEINNEVTAMEQVNVKDCKEFDTAVRCILPTLCFGPEQVEEFLARAKSGAIEQIHAIGDAGGRAFVSGSKFRVDFIIPSDWPQRFAIVERAVKELQGSRKYIRMDISERAASHGAYFTGLLPGLGFELEPRLAMSAGLEALAKLGRPSLPAGYRELALTLDRADEVARVLYEAYKAVRPGWSARPADDLDMWENNARFAIERHSRYCAAVEHGGRIVGACLGSVTGRGLGIHELAVLPESWRQGLGRFMMIRCMQKIEADCEDPAARFTLGTNRTYSAAIALYRSLGFETSDVYTRATWRGTD